MAPRAYWKGYLKLSLVTCPIALYPASSQAEKTHFHQISRRTGHRLRQQMIDEETGKAVDKDDKSRGYEIAKGKDSVHATSSRLVRLARQRSKRQAHSRRPEAMRRPIQGRRPRQ